MRRPWKSLGVLAICCLPLDAHVTRGLAAQRNSPMAALPRITLWTWERREDLRGIDPAVVAVASLERTLLQEGPRLTVRLQSNALTLPADGRLQRLVVVRLQTHRPLLTATTAERVAEAMVGATQGRPVSALQIDFDAVRSERAWYRMVLGDVRARLRPEIPLSITALASWCSHDRWMGGLPIGEAIPMLFRMEPGVRGLSDHEITVQEPLCMTAVGLSTREAWPANLRNKRVYVFPDRGWRAEDTAEIVRRLQ